MFSQFRQAVETFAPQPRRSTDDQGAQLTHSRSQSTDISSPTSPSALAESALSNLRRSFAPHRPASPAASQRTSNTSSPRPHKSTLEERLRAVTFTVGEATPDSSSRTSPAPLVPTNTHPLSPSSTPLPESPVVTSPSDVNLPSGSHLSDEAGLIASKELKQNAAESTAQPVQEDVPNTEQGTSSRLSDDADSNAQKEPEKALAESIVQPVQAEEDVQETGQGTSSLVSDDAVSNEVELKELEQVYAETTVQPAQEDVQETEQNTPPVADELFTPAPRTEAETESSPQHASEAETPVEHCETANASVEELQERLKLVGQRFTDVSISFKRLQAEKLAADAVLRELTPIESLKESEALRDYLKNVALKVEISQNEIKRLNDKLQTQEDRIEELRDTHRLESRSQSDQIDNLRRQLQESEALLKASQSAISLGEEDLVKRKTEVDQLNREVAKVKEVAKEEEEKRVKAINLLKTVRQKLVKTEKEKEEALKEAWALKEKEKVDREKEEGEKAKLQKEIESVNAERDRAIAGFKAQFNKEVAIVKERHEKELTAIRSQLEIDAVTAKAAYAKELDAKTSQIAQLETSLDAVTRDKNSFFDQLQLRQAEVESSRAHLESLQNQMAEQTHQLREYEDRLALIKEELQEARLQASDTRESSASSEDAARLLSAVEAKYEAKVAELRRTLSVIEKERNESDAEWSRKLREKNKETEDLKRSLGTATKSKQQDQGIAGDLKAEISHLQETLQSQQAKMTRLQAEIAQLKDTESSAATRELESETKIKVLEQKIEEAKSRENQMRSNNKILREELRKVQSSAALLDRQRNPGVGYWTSRESPSTASSESLALPSSPLPSNGQSSAVSTSSTKAEEEVNLEYLRNVILQFLEHKEMRPNLVKVLSIILHFTPQETRRLLAKV